MTKPIKLLLLLWLLLWPSLWNKGISQVLFGTDELGRVLVQNPQVGSPLANRKVALFYFLWQGDIHSPTTPHQWNLPELVRAHPEVLNDRNHKAWGGGMGQYYFWGESIYGYYRGDDFWVHLKNMQLLTDAQVDFLVLDATNALIYPTQSRTLMQAISTIQQQGKTPPQIVYYTNTESGKTMQQIYDTYYKESALHRFPHTWFHLNGKPLIIGVSREARGSAYENFFTFRESQWPTVPQVMNGWPWISFKRIPEVHYNSDGLPEIANVSVAQHPNPGAGMGGSAFYGNTDNWGRSYRNNHPGQPEKDLVYGYNFQEQWDAVLKENLPFVFVTGWNEWIVGRWKTGGENSNHSYFVDQANAEYSRDIEPTLTAGLKDHYYMQLVNNIRRYKGIPQAPIAKRIHTIQRFSDWEKVELVYADYMGDTLHRHHLAATSKPEILYTNTTGRNDIKWVKLTNDAKHLFFYAETVRPLTTPMADNWMRIYIDWDRNYTTGWQGYDYRIIWGHTLQHFVQGQWKNLPVKLKRSLLHNQLMVALPIRFMQGGKINAFEFKWSDNMQREDPMDWYINGDAAPGGRFNYFYAPAALPVNKK